MKAGFKYERLYLNVKIFYFLIIIINSLIRHESTGTVLKVLLEEFLYWDPFFYFKGSSYFSDTSALKCL